MARAPRKQAKKGAIARHSDGSVGYGRPPAKHRFKPGHSGNPKGRPKGARNLGTRLTEIMTTPIAVRQNGKLSKVSVLEAVLMRLQEQALKGAERATLLLLKLAGEMGMLKAPDMEQTESDLTPAEKKLFDRYAALLTGKR